MNNAVTKTTNVLIEAARVLFTRNGYDRTTMSDIAREAKKGRRTLYVHFPSKEALLRKVAEASLVVRQISNDAKGRKRIIVTNNSSIRWIIARNGQRTEELRPHSSQIFTAKSKDNSATLLNTWSGEDSHLVINLFDLAK